MPFSTGLWLAIIATILVFALLSAFLSPARFQEETTASRNHQDANNETEFSSSTRMKRAATTLGNAISWSLLDFMGGHVAYEVKMSASQKFLNVGFAFFIFVCVAAYTGK